MQLQYASSVETTFEMDSEPNLSSSCFHRAETQQDIASFVRLDIQVNHESGYQEKCVYNKKELVTEKSFNLTESSAIFVNIEKSKFKTMTLREMTMENTKKLKERGFEQLVQVDLDKHKTLFHIQLPDGQLREKQDHLKKTYLCISDESVERMKVYSGDLVKFGREIYKVSLVQKRISPKFQWYREAQEQMALEGECKICLTSEQTEENCILNPCFCKGSCGLVHIECLRKWLKVRTVISQKQKATAYNLNVFHCEICKTHLPKYVAVDNQTYELFPFSLESESFLLLESMSQKDIICFITSLQSSEEIDLTIGRYDENDLTIPENSISRKHARLEISNGRIELSDRDSKYGTMVELKRNLRGVRRVVLARDRFFFNFTSS